MGRKKTGDFIRKVDFKNAVDDNDDNAVSKQIYNFKSAFRDGVTFAEIKDTYAAYEQVVCVRNFGYRHSPQYWGASAIFNVLNDLKSDCDDDSEATHLEYGRMDMSAWLASLKAGPCSAVLELMSKFRGRDFDEYVKTLEGKEVGRIFREMKIQFNFDDKDTDLKEQTYGSFLYNEVRGLFKDLGFEKLSLAQAEYLDLYLHYFKQLPYFSDEMACYVGYIVRDMSDAWEVEVPGKSRAVKNPYMNFKNVEVMKKHVATVKTLLMEFKGDLDKQRFHYILGNITKATVADGLTDQMFDCLVDVLMNFAKKKNSSANGKRIYDVFRNDLFGEMKGSSPAMCDQSLKVVKSLVAGVTDSYPKDFQAIVDKSIDSGICGNSKMTPEQVKSLLELLNMLLASGHEKMVDRAVRIIEHKNLDKVLLWKKYLDDVKLFMKTISHQPVDKMWSDRPGRTDDVVDKYDRFMQKLLEKLTDLKVISKLNEDLRTYIFDCLEYGNTKADLAYYASDDRRFVIKKADPPELIETILERCITILKKDELPDSTRFRDAIRYLIEACIKSYNGNGRAVTPKQHKLFMAVFLTTLSGDDIDDVFFPPGQEKYGSVKLWVFRDCLIKYIRLHQETATHACCVGLVPDILRWAKVAEEEERDEVKDPCLTALQLFSTKPPKEMAGTLKQIMDLFVNPENMSDLLVLTTTLYQHNPGPVHERLQELVDMFETLKEHEKSMVIQVITTVAGAHPEVFTDEQVGFLFDQCKADASFQQQMQYISILHTIAKRRPQKLHPHFSTLLDNKVFSEQTLLTRAYVIACATGRNEKLSQQAIDFFMKMSSNKDSTIQQTGLGQLAYMAKDHKDYMVKYKASLKKLESSSTVPEVRQSCNNLIQVLEGKNYEDVFEDLYKEIQEQQEITAELDSKLDHTMNTVITMGEHVTEHHKDLINVKHDLGDLEEKVEDIDEDLGQTKIKVEEIDNKTMTNAPKWSRDLTKLMNPKHDCDWRMLASRLGYSNDDIRAWAQQHDPCMAVLSEWYATHKTSEANHAVLTHLTEMNRLDGTAIVENAMKSSEGVVEDEEFEYPSPPPIFLSYQWGMQNEVKLLKQHLNMAGYECWMDIGQMGGGDKLFAKIDNGIRAAKVIICCVTDKYSQSPNCNREVNLSVNLGKPMIPLLMDKMNWPPKGAMGPIFSEYLFIRFFQRGGEETKDNRYWPVPKFEELLMQLNYSVPPDESKITKEYNKWWVPIVEDIVIDKNKGKSGTVAQSSSGQSDSSSDASPLVFLSYQWGKQPQVKALYQRICSLGYTVWMDIFQMGGGDSLYDKIDRGVRGCKVVVTCVTPKYALSANCRREVSLADALKKPIVPLLLEQMKWPPDGPMSMVFTELLYIQVYRDPDIQVRWTGEKFDELAMKLQQYVGDMPTTGQGSTAASQEKPASQSKSKSVIALPPPAQTKQEKPAGTQTKSKPDGSATQSKFVEPKNKAGKPPAKEEKTESSTPKAQSSASKPTGKTGMFADRRNRKQESQEEPPSETKEQDENQANTDNESPKLSLLQKRALKKQEEAKAKQEAEAKQAAEAKQEAPKRRGIHTHDPSQQGKEQQKAKPNQEASQQGKGDKANQEAETKQAAEAKPDAPKRRGIRTHDASQQGKEQQNAKPNQEASKPKGGSTNVGQGKMQDAGKPTRQTSQGSPKKSQQSAPKPVPDNTAKPTPDSDKPKSSSCVIL